MIVITIGSDRDLFKEGSDVSLRVLGYAQHVKEMHIIVFARASLGLRKVMLGNNVTIYPTNSSSRIGYILDALRIARTLHSKLNGGALVISVQDPFEAGCVGLLVKRALGVPLQVQEHGDFFSGPYWRKESFLNRLRYYLGRYVLKHADCIRVVSTRIKETLTTTMELDERKISVLPVMTEESDAERPPDFSRQNKIVPFEHVVLSAGRFVPQKNFSLLLEAFRDVHIRIPTAGLVIVGSGHLEDSLRAHAQALGIEKSVVFHGWTDLMNDFYASADVFALSSNYEGWGRVIIEALAYEVPVVMTDVGCAGDAVRDGQEGIVVPIGDAKALSEGIIKLLSDEELRGHMGKLGQEHVRQYFRNDDYYKKYIDLLRACSMIQE